MSELAETLKRGKRLERQVRQLVRPETDHVAVMFALSRVMTTVARKKTRTKLDAIALPVSFFLRQAGDHLNEACERARIAAIAMSMREHGLLPEKKR